MGLFDSLFSRKKDPAPDYLPPGITTPDPHRKEADELAVKAFTLMQQGMMSGSKDLMKEALANANKALELDPDCYNALQCKVATVSMFQKDDKNHLLLEALACTERALVQKKDNASMWYNRAGILEQLGRYPEAIEAYDKSRSCDVDGTAGPLVAKARVLEKMDRDNEALRIYASISPTDPSYVDAAGAKARMMERKGRRDEALAGYRAAASLYHRKRDDSNARLCLDQVLRLEPSDKGALHSKAAALLNQYTPAKSARMLSEAEACIDAALAQEPQNAGFLTVKGRCRFEMDHPEESLEYYDKALAQSPSDFEAVMHKGFSLNRLMRSDEALEVFNRACSLSPDSPLPWSMKAMIRYEQGDNEQGLKDIDEAIGRSERDRSSWEIRAKILRKLGRTAAADEAGAMAKRYDPRWRAGR